MLLLLWPRAEDEETISCSIFSTTAMDSTLGPWPASACQSAQRPGLARCSSPYPNLSSRFTQKPKPHFPHHPLFLFIFCSRCSPHGTAPISFSPKTKLCPSEQLPHAPQLRSPLPERLPLRRPPARGSLSPISRSSVAGRSAARPLLLPGKVGRERCTHLCACL